MKQYEGKRTGNGLRLVRVVVGADIRPLELGPSLKLRNHSPTGFEWGYGGSGPSQLALALLLDATGREDDALCFYQDFKREVVASWVDQWAITDDEIERWLALIKKDYAVA